jgi:hypothetical protein
MSEKLGFTGLDDVLKHFTAKGEEVERRLAVYRSQVTELTGHDLSKPVTALDVVKIVQKVFFGGQHGYASISGVLSRDVSDQPGAAQPPPLATQGADADCD